MFFTRLAGLVATLVFVLALIQVLLGVAIATEFIGPYEASLARYSTASSSGQMMDRGIYGILFALGLGTLAEISFAVRRVST